MLKKLSLRLAATSELDELDDADTTYARTMARSSGPDLVALPRRNVPKETSLVHLDAERMIEPVDAAQKTHKRVHATSQLARVGALVP